MSLAWDRGQRDAQHEVYRREARALSIERQRYEVTGDPDAVVVRPRTPEEEEWERRANERQATETAAGLWLPTQGEDVLT